uniref:Si:dkey-112e17.1 n=1 Tax=Lepisosteus oculatus TaxID=7918 RepID=W5M428_LEPOC
MYTAKVYFDCGAVVDVVDEQGLVLSPGFPYNYSSGTHCVWQFFVPVGYRLTMEVFDFDVFESPGSTGMVVTPNGLPRQTQVSATKTSWGSSERLPPLPSKTEEVRQVVVQEESTKMEMAKVSNSAKRSTDLHPGVKPQSRQAGTRAENSVSPDTYRRPAYEENATSVPETSTGAAETGAETRPSSAEACPHDVLYISDLTTFSSRFCGSNKPTGRRLAFGSSREMVEVIMELITTTHWGRGFVLLFQYRNETDEADGHFRKPTASRTDALLAATSGAAFFLVILTGALCIIF